MNKFKVGDKVKFIVSEASDRSDYCPNFESSSSLGCEIRSNSIARFKKNEGVIIKITNWNNDKWYTVRFLDYNNNETALGFLEKYLIPLEIKPQWKSMKLIEYKKIAKLRDKIRIIRNGRTIEGICGGLGGKIHSQYFYFWQNEKDGNSNRDPQGEYKYSFAYSWEDNFEVELLTDKTFTKKRKAYIEITKETGKIYISLKIPTEIEDFFKNISEVKSRTSETWFQKDKGVEYYSQPKELEKKLTEIDEYVFSDFGSGLMRDNLINVAILRTIGCSKGVKIHSDGFSSLTNADLQDYVRRLGLYIKRLWESNISSTKIKSVITFEI